MEIKNIKKKNVYLVVAINECAWYGKEDVKERLKKLPLTIQYVIKKNMKPLQEMEADFQQFRDEQEMKLKEKWFDDEHSVTTKVKQPGPDGKEQEVDGRQIKDEFLKDYQADVLNLNKQLEGLLTQTDEVKYTPINLDYLVETAGDDSITIDDVDMISLFSEEDNTEEDGE